MPTSTDLILLGLIGLAVFVLGWCIYHAGKANQRASEAREDVSKAVAVEKSNNELIEQSNQAKDSALDAGAAAGPAPADPLSLPDSVRARIFRKRR
jgi:predicted negative regulator of RcsB-dependent stress response